jgi:hypothetical protein
MAKKTKEVVEQTTKTNEPKGDVTKVIEKMNKPTEVIGETITKVDLSKPPKTETDAVQERETEEVHVEESSGDSKEMGEGGTESNLEETQQVQDEPKTEDTPVIEEITNETEDEVEVTKEQIEEAIDEAEATGKSVPENIQKLMNFMEETGGDINDYVKLNQDYGKLDEDSLLREYYRQTKPHLNAEEINFLMEDTFSYDEEVDDERDIRRKKLALKEQVANAKAQLEENKSKYYEDIKAGSKLTTEQQKAIDFFNRYNEESKENNRLIKEQSDSFLNKTNQVFNDKFKGFEYNIGDKKFRFNVNNADEIKETQSDINNFVKKFLNKDNKWDNAKGYHKSLFTAMNADAIANHFYEQGKADAIKDSVAKAKNVDMNPRQSHGVVEAGGIKVRVLGDDSPGLKYKIQGDKLRMKNKK